MQKYRDFKPTLKIGYWKSGHSLAASGMQKWKSGPFRAVLEALKTAGFSPGVDFASLDRLKSRIRTVQKFALPRAVKDRDFAGPRVKARVAQPTTALSVTSTSDSAGKSGKDG